MRHVVGHCAAPSVTRTGPLMELMKTTTTYVTPDFSVAGARTGYVRRRLATRSSILGSLLLHPKLVAWTNTLSFTVIWSFAVSKFAEPLAQWRVR